MNPASPIPAVIAVAFALVSARLMQGVVGVPSTQGRYSGIDGLRGYLAFFVFLQHAVVWHFHLEEGTFRPPESHLYRHLGESSVALFFMITGFLFFSKLIESRDSDLDWRRLYVSRFLRIVPLYLFSMILLFTIVAVVSRGQLIEPVPALVKHALAWLGFTFTGMPKINGLSDTLSITAGVAWTLPYEWFYYFSLPFIAFVIRVKAPIRYIAAGIAINLVCLKFWNASINHMLAFPGGMLAAVLVRNEAFRKLAATRIATLAIAVCLAAVVTFETAYAIQPILLLTIAFSFIAGGNTFLGLLTHSASRLLGEISYSIYLLHGIILYVTFTFIVGTESAKNLSVENYWMVILLAVPVVVVISSLTFRFVEQPALRQTARVSAWLAERFQ